jgi:O-antigen/teichoic acid export membrane protein
MYKTSNARIAQNTVFLFVRMGITMIVTLYSSRLLLQVLGESDFGIFNVVGGVIAMMSFFNTAMTLGFQRYLNISLGKNDSDGYHAVFRAALAIQIVLGIIVLTILETVGLWFLHSKMIIPEDRVLGANIVFQASVTIFLLNILKAPLVAIVISHEKMDQYAYVSIIDVGLKLLTILLVPVFDNDNLIVYSVLLIIEDIIILITYIYVDIRIDKMLTFRPQFNVNLIKDMFGFSGWNLFGSFAHLAKGQGVNVLLNTFFGPSVNAARGIAFQVSAGVDVFFASFQTAVRPQIMKSFACGNINEMMRLVFFMSRMSFFLMWIITLPLLLNTNFVLHFWLGENFPQYTCSFSQIVLLTCFVDSLANPISTIVHATGKMKRFQIICSSVIFSILPISYLVLYFGGDPNSALYTSLSVSVLVQIVRLILIKDVIDFSIKRYCIKVLLPCFRVVVISLPLPLFVKMLNISDWVVIFISLLAAILSCFFLGMTTNERKTIYEKVGYVFRNHSF